MKDNFPTTAIILCKHEVYSSKKQEQVNKILKGKLDFKKQFSFLILLYYVNERFYN